MKALFSALAIAVTMTVGAHAQDNTVKSKTTVKSDDARTLTMTGCLQETARPSTFMLYGASAASGDELKSRSKVKTDVDKDDTKVTSKGETKAGAAIGTAGLSAAYELTPRSGVDLSP